MKKLFILLTGLLSITSLPILNQEQKIMAEQKQWSTEAIVVKEYVKAKEWLYFAIDNINLSSIGINSINDLHTYKVIEIPQLLVRFNSYKDIDGDFWTTKHNLGSEDWFRLYWQVVDGVTMILERAATIWYSESGDLMLRLAYHASIAIAFSTGVVQGSVLTFKSGSVVKFY
ncbi:MAG: hypothetical protein REH79_02745 [Spiroplasma sp.]|nr:hypothetical protein [Spiroplasma sp.]